MVGYFIFDALIITCLVGLVVMFIQSAIIFGIKIYRHFKYKQDAKNYRLSLIERQISALQKNDEVHKNVINRHTERLDVLEEKLNKKETKKNVKKKKRN